MHVCACTRRRVRVPTCTHACRHATDQYVILIAVHSNNGFVNAPQCSVIRTLPVLFVFYFATKRKARLAVARTACKYNGCRDCGNCFRVQQSCFSHEHVVFPLEATKGPTILWSEWQQSLFAVRHVRNTQVRCVAKMHLLTTGRHRFKA